MFTAMISVSIKSSTVLVGASFRFPPPADFKTTKAATMRCFALIVLAALAACVYADDMYSTEFDSVDVNAILNNDRLTSSYIECLLHGTKCTREGNALKRVLSEAMATDCAKCNQKQKTAADKVIHHLRTKRAADWKLILAKYDTQGDFEARYAKITKFGA